MSWSRAGVANGHEPAPATSDRAADGDASAPHQLCELALVPEGSLLRCAIALLRRTATDLPSDGGDVVEHLRAVPQLGLSSDQAQRYVAAVDQLDTAIHAFVGGLPSGSDGWSTVPVTAVVTDVCGRQAPGVSIVP